MQTPTGRSLALVVAAAVLFASVAKAAEDPVVAAPTSPAPSPPAPEVAPSAMPIAPAPTAAPANPPPPPAPQFVPYPYYPYYPPSPPLRTVHQANRRLVKAGAIVFGVSWSFAALASLVINGESDCSNCQEQTKTVVIPVFGPIAANLEGNGNEGRQIAILWSLTEAAGVAMFIAGLIGHDVKQRTWVGSAIIVPLASRDVQGFGLRAAF